MKIIIELFTFILLTSSLPEKNKILGENILELIHIIIVGILSCLAMDLWQRLLNLLYRISPSNWAVVGRWFMLSILKGKIYNPSIDDEPSIHNELRIGWLVHYFVAIMYSLTFFILINYKIMNASFFDGLKFGLVSVVVPWFFFMPLLGKGFLGIKTPTPLLTCSLAIWSHSVIGIAIGTLFQFFGY